MTSIKEKKKELRIYYKGLRQELSSFDQSGLSFNIFRKLVPHILNDRIVALYANIGNEVWTRKILNFLQLMNIQPVYPIVQKKKQYMKFAPVYKNTKMKLGEFGTLEPDTQDRIALYQINTIVVPGVAFDPYGIRLGFGKGHYDATLSNYTGGGQKIGICYDFQIANELPAEIHDVRMDKIITDRRIIDLSS